MKTLLFFFLIASAEAYEFRASGLFAVCRFQDPTEESQSNLIGYWKQDNVDYWFITSEDGSKMILTDQYTPDLTNVQLWAHLSDGSDIMVQSFPPNKVKKIKIS